MTNNSLLFLAIPLHKLILVFLGQMTRTDEFYYYFGVDSQRIFKPKKKTLEDFLSSHDGTFNLVHRQANCKHHNCTMNAYMFTHSSTEAASQALPVVQIHRDATNHFYWPAIWLH